MYSRYTYTDHLVASGDFAEGEADALIGTRDLFGGEQARAARPWGTLARVHANGQPGGYTQGGSPGRWLGGYTYFEGSLIPYFSVCTVAFSDRYSCTLVAAFS